MFTSAEMIVCFTNPGDTGTRTSSTGLSVWSISNRTLLSLSFIYSATASNSVLSTPDASHKTQSKGNGNVGRSLDKDPTATVLTRPKSFAMTPCSVPVCRPAVSALTLDSSSRVTPRTLATSTNPTSGLPVEANSQNNRMRCPRFVE